MILNNLELIPGKHSFPFLSTRSVKFFVRNTSNPAPAADFCEIIDVNAVDVAGTPYIGPIRSLD